ncbi:hypothetical protein CYMTET_16399, partial [Cymbomonas tetramitiformis]
VNFREPRFLENRRVPKEVLASRLKLRLDLPPGSPPEMVNSTRAGEPDVLRMAKQSWVEHVALELKRIRTAGSGPRIVEVDGTQIRDELSLCLGSRAREFNNKMFHLLGGQLVQFCSKERSPFIGSVGQALLDRGIDPKKGLNCSYPGKWKVTSNPLDWADNITYENRQGWIGEPLKECAL